MNDFTKSHKLGELEFGDQHYLVRFNRDDYKPINKKYFEPIIMLNDFIDTTMHELYMMNREIEKMVHYKNNKKMVWSYQHDTLHDAAKYYMDAERLQKHLDSLLHMRASTMDEFHTNLKRGWNDQTVQDKKFEPEEIAKSDDLVPLTGIAQAAKQITNETLKKWEWFGLGRSEIPADFDQEFLFDEINRYFIKTHGAFGAIGEVIRLLVVSPDSMGTEDIAEICIANAQSGGNILFRTVLEKKVHHEAGEHFLATSSNIYLVSRR